MECPPPCYAAETERSRLSSLSLSLFAFALLSSLSLSLSACALAAAFRNCRSLYVNITNVAWEQQLMNTVAAGGAAEEIAGCECLAHAA